MAANFIRGFGLSLAFTSLFGCLSGGVLKSGVDRYSIRQGMQCDNGEVKLTMDRLRTPITLSGAAVPGPKEKYISTYHFLLPRKYLDGVSSKEKITIHAQALIPTDMNANAISCPGHPIDLDVLPQGAIYLGNPYFKLKTNGSEQIVEIKKKGYASWHYPYQILLAPAFALDVVIFPFYVIAFATGQH